MKAARLAWLAWLLAAGPASAAEIKVATWNLDWLTPGRPT